MLTTLSTSHTGVTDQENIHPFKIMADSFSPPEQVRKNAARSLELRKKHGRGMTAVGVARARDLSNGKNISADTIKRMHSYFARHEVDKKGKDWANQSNPSAGYIAWLGWGGDAGRSWVNGIMKKLNAKESQEISDMASTKAATIRGVFLKPGVSKNRRLYTKNNIAKAVQRMNEHLAKGEGMPLNMATSHAAAFQDDATSTVGRITAVSLLPDGSATFEAEIANTAHGRDVANLAAGNFIKGVSIRGEWAAEPRAVVHSDGEEATTADDLMVHGIDFTNSPGVEGAEIKYAQLSESDTSKARFAIFESIDDVEIVEKFVEPEINTEEIIRNAVESALEELAEAKDAKKPYGNVTYADPGYQKDKQKRYPINTAAHVRAAWSYINQDKNASLYTAAQLARVKARIKSAAKKFGINIVSEHETLASDIAQVLEAYASISLNNDFDTINITGYAVDPHQLRTVANRIAFGAIAAMHAIDPDDDGDIYLSKPDWSQVDATGDASGMGPEIDGDEMYTSDDNNMECASCGNMSEASTYCPACGALMSPLSNTDGITCVQCGTPTVKGALYCHNCGVSKESADTQTCANCGESNCPAEAVACHMCGEQLSGSMTQNALGCTTCGETTPQDAMYCPNCGDPIPQAESFDDAPTTDKESEVSDETTAAEAPVEVAAEESTATRTLSDADLKALASIIAAAIQPVESTPEPEEEVEVETAEVEPEVTTEESTNSQENQVTEKNMFSAEEVAKMVAEAAQKAATAAVEQATQSAVESYRSGKVFRKGLVGGSMGSDASDLSEAELTPEALAEMNSSQFRKVQSETWGATPFFANKFAQADRGF